MSLLHNSFDSEYELMLTAWGDGVLKESDLISARKADQVFGEFEKTHGRPPKDISLLIDDPRASGLDYGFTGVDAALLEKLETLKELVLPDSITELEVTPKLAAILRENDTLIRGAFDSFAERFAAERGLHFRPSDFSFAFHYFEASQEHWRLTLKFRRDGSVYIEEDVSSPGSSAGNSFGGTRIYELSRDFYLTQTAEDIADMFGASLRSSTLKKGRMAAFLEKAKTHGLYMGEN